LWVYTTVFQNTRGINSIRNIFGMFALRFLLRCNRPFRFCGTLMRSRWVSSSLLYEGKSKKIGHSYFEDGGETCRRNVGKHPLMHVTFQKTGTVGCVNWVPHRPAGYD